MISLEIIILAISLYFTNKSILKLSRKIERIEDSLTYGSKSGNEV